MHRQVIEVFRPRTRPHGYIFHKRDGRCYTLHRWHYWLRKLKSQVPELWGWHDFRRTFAVKLGKAGVPPIDVMHYLGHAKLDTTMKYMNWSPANYNPNIENA